MLERHELVPRRVAHRLHDALVRHPRGHEHLIDQLMPRPLKLRPGLSERCVIGRYDGRHTQNHQQRSTHVIAPTNALPANLQLYSMNQLIR